MFLDPKYVQTANVASEKGNNIFMNTAKYMSNYKISIYIIPISG